MTQDMDCRSGNRGVPAIAQIHNCRPHSIINEHRTWIVGVLSEACQRLPEYVSAQRTALEDHRKWIFRVERRLPEYVTRLGYQGQLRQ